MPTEVATVDSAEVQNALAGLYADRLAERSETAPVFKLTEVATDDRPVLIQCCIR